MPLTALGVWPCAGFMCGRKVAALLLAFRHASPVTGSSRRVADGP